MQLIPLNPVGAQTMAVLVNNQDCQLNVYKRSNYGVFVDLYVSNVLVIGGVIAQNLNRIVRDGYLGFAGDFIFADSEGTSDPTPDGLGSRYELWYLSPADLALLGLNA